MAESVKNEEVKRLPGMAVPWTEILPEIEPILGDEQMIKNEWEKLDAFAYIYLWWWVHR